MLKVAVIGATGYTGEQIVDLIVSHPEAEVCCLTSRIEEPVLYSDKFPRFKGRLNANLEPLDVDKVIDTADVVFLSLPHTVSFQYAPLFHGKGKTVIDLSADYRLQDHTLYEKYYKVTHTDTGNLSKAVYGLPELNRDKISESHFIANPGCYPTVSSLSLLPLVKEGLLDDIIIDAKSGVSGAGRKASLPFHYAEFNENMYAYKVFEHQHVPEIEQTLSAVAGSKVNITFTPQVMAFERGIYLTAYANLTKDLSEDDIAEVYNAMYAEEPFIRLYRGVMPKLKDVRNTNFCDIGFAVRGRKLIVCACIDNLMKGAGSQAVQNMNIVHGLEETMGLI